MGVSNVKRERLNMERPSLTIGIEEEYQIVDPDTRELRAYITELLEAGKIILAEQVKAELHQSIVEVGTNVCRPLADLAQQLLIFGTHIHIGIEDREFMIDAMNVARYLLPHLLCLSPSSPFWMGGTT